jgi:hypothetical protein
MKRKAAMIIVMIVTVLTYAVGFSSVNHVNLKKLSFNNTKAILQKQGEVKLNNPEKAVAPEKNPPGDIPDTQVFVKYVSKASGYKIQAPEGWARKVKVDNVSFIDKFDGLKIEISKTKIPLTVESIKKNQVADMQKSGRAVNIKLIKEVKLGSGKAILVSFDSNSEPNLVTNKQIRLENESYFFYKDGKLALLTLWAPLGADNVDQWKLISNSFRW